MSREKDSDPADRSTLEGESEQKPSGLLREFFDFLRHHKKWWLLPILFALILLGLLAAFSGDRSSFIYPF